MGSGYYETDKKDREKYKILKNEISLVFNQT